MLRLNDDQANRPQERMSAAAAAAVAVVMTYTWMLVVVVVATRSMEKYPIGFPECPSDPMLQCGQETRFEAGLIRALRMRREADWLHRLLHHPHAFARSPAFSLVSLLFLPPSLPPSLPRASGTDPAAFGDKIPIYKPAQDGHLRRRERERVKVGHVAADLNAMAAIREACRSFGSGQGRAFAAR